MTMTYSAFVDRIEATLQDSTNAVFSTDEIDAAIDEALAEYSYWRPREIKNTILTASASKDLTLSTGDKHRLLYVDRLEYKVAQTPQQFRTFKRHGDVLTMDIDFDPAASESVYLYLCKRHIFQESIGTTDTAGAVKTAGAAGATTLALKALGTGTINLDTQLTIAGDATIYTVVTTVTIVTNEATVTINPVLAAAAAADAVVTLAAQNSLDDIQEWLIANLAAAKAAMSKSRSYMNKVNVGGSGGLASRELMQWGQAKWAETINEIRGIRRTRQSTLESRD